MSMLDKIPAPSEKDCFTWPDMLRVLVMDQHLFDMKRLDRLVRMLDVPTEVHSTRNLQEMNAALARQNYDLIVISHSLPDTTALQTLDAIRLTATSAGAATVLITEPDNHPLGIAAIKRGCGDYITSDTLSPEIMKKAALNAMFKARLDLAARNRVANSAA